MGRKPKIRVNYAADAVYLTNLIRAIEMDDKRSADWKKKVIAKLSLVIADFMEDQSKNLRKAEM